MAGWEFSIVYCSVTGYACSERFCFEICSLLLVQTVVNDCRVEQHQISVVLTV